MNEMLNAGYLMVVFNPLYDGTLVTKKYDLDCLKILIYPKLWP